VLRRFSSEHGMANPTFNSDAFRAFSKDGTSARRNRLGLDWITGTAPVDTVPLHVQPVGSTRADTA
jgi:hypothetical protein